MGLKRKRVVRVVLIFGVALLTVAVFGANSGAAPPPPKPGALDPAFGKYGLVEHRLGTSSGQVATASTQLRDGRLVLAGRNASGSMGIVARYLPGGALDETFGEAGFITVPRINFDAVMTGEDRNVILAGHDGDTAAMIRLLPDGTLDPEFGTDGVATTGFGPIGEDLSESEVPEAPRLTAIAQADDGSLIAAGTSSGCRQSGCRFAISWRLDSSGTPLPLRGREDGTWAGYPYEELTVVDLLPDGRMVTAGVDYEEDFDQSMYPWNGITVSSAPKPDGTVRTLWQDGFSYQQGVMEGPGTVAAFPGGGFLLGSGDLLYKANRTGPDEAFGTEGRIRFHNGLFHGSARNEIGPVRRLAVDPDGNLLAAGPGPEKSVFLARLDPAGTPDPTFSNDGLWTSRWLDGTPTSGDVVPGLLVNGSRYLVTYPSRTPNRGFPIIGIRWGKGEPARCGGRPATWIGGPGSDDVKADSGVIVTGGGGDFINLSARPAAGSIICAGAGNDRITFNRGAAYGGPGNDRINSGWNRGSQKHRPPSRERMVGGPGDDRLQGHAGDDHLLGGTGNDLVHGGSGDDDVIGGPGRDRLYGGPGNDRVLGGPGRDRVNGGPGRKPDQVYEGRKGSTRITMTRKGKGFSRVEVAFDYYCSGPGSYGLYRSHSVIRKRIELRGNGNRFRFEGIEDGGDWWYEVERLRGRLRGRFVTGSYMFTNSQPWWDACWTGKSLRKPWVGFRARLQPPAVQVVRQ